ncbi:MULTISPECIES: hypothetical protein [unclassified Streptomyces]|uniref:hypothetical protein n=1 Tax=unclassified Streptomyces TaxID=2593676 RepID=UPI003D75A29A
MTSVSRLLYAADFSEGGSQRAPAVGEVIRDPHPGRVTFVDVPPLSADRSTADAPRPEVNRV